jgi:hypothetical protein
MVAVEYSALLQPCYSKVQAWSNMIGKSICESVEDCETEERLPTNPKRCQTACSLPNWVNCFCGHGVECETPFTNVHATISHDSSHDETINSVDMLPEDTMEEEVCSIFSSLTCNMYIEEKVKGVPVDCLTRVPLDLYMTLLEAGDRAKLRGGHTVARRRSDSRRRSTHLLKTNEIKHLAAEDELDL